MRKKSYFCNYFMVFLKNEEFDEGRFDTFVGQKDFEKAYRITKKELLEKYDYNKYKEEKEKENGRII